MIDHPSIPGIHHVTAIASGAQTNYNFYTDVLGLRLVKRTVNFDAPDTYNFYYGDSAGHPGNATASSACSKGKNVIKVKLKRPVEALEEPLQ